MAPVQHEGPLLLAVDLGDDDLSGCGLIEELHHCLRAQHWGEEGRTQTDRQTIVT